MRFPTPPKLLATPTRHVDNLDPDHGWDCAAARGVIRQIRAQRADGRH